MKFGYFDDANKEYEQITIEKVLYIWDIQSRYVMMIRLWQTS